MTTTCAGYRRWLSSYVDEVLEPGPRAQLDDHLKDCGPCRQELASLQGMLQTLRTLEPTTSPDLVPGVRRRLGAASWWRRLASRFTAPWPVSLPLHGLALATTALLVVVAANLPGVARWDKLAQERTLVIAKQESVDAVGTVVLEAGSKDAGFRPDAGWSATSNLAAEKQASISGSEVLEQRQGVDGAFTGLTDAPPSAVPTISAEDDRAGRRRRVPIGTNSSLGATSWNGTSPADERGDLKVSEESLVMAALANVEQADLTMQEEPHPATESAAFKSASPPPSGSALEPIQAQWRVADFAVAASQVSEWVSARQGWAVATNEHHLSIKLPASAVPEFLQQFVTEAGTTAPSGGRRGNPEDAVRGATDPPPAPSADQPIWITISLELVASP